MAANHVGGGPSVVGKREVLWIKIELTSGPVLQLAQDVGAALLGRVPGLFSSVILGRRQKRCTAPMPTRAPRAVNYAWVSTRVISLCSASGSLMKALCTSILLE